MGQRIDLTGKSYGRLTVRELCRVVGGKSYWLCECECGKLVTVRGDHLTGGHTISCGCARPKREDLTGAKFGRLTVITFDHMDIHGQPHWLCECSCGTKITVRASHLKSGHTTSCGCYIKEWNAGTKTKHGQSRSRIYDTWAHMKDRCENPNSKKYDRYGDRVAPERFLEALGEVIKNISILAHVVDKSLGDALRASASRMTDAGDKEKK